MASSMTWRHKCLSFSIRLVPGALRGIIRGIPGVAAMQRAAIRIIGRNEEFEHVIDYGPAKGLKLPIRLPQDKGFWKGTYEEEFCRRLASAVQPGDVCFDIGAFRGYTAGVMALAGAVRVTAFEPVAANQDVMARVMAMNPHLPMDLVRAAVGAECGKIRMTIHEDASMNFIGKDGSGRPEIEVDLVSVDDVVSEGKHPAPRLLKIDVEAAEAAVLRGAAKVLRDSVREVFVEMHHHDARRECEELLEAAGFECVWRADEGGVYPVQTHFRKK